MKAPLIQGGRQCCVSPRGQDKQRETSRKRELAAREAAAAVEEERLRVVAEERLRQREAAAAAAAEAARVAAEQVLCVCDTVCVRAAAEVLCRVESDRSRCAQCARCDAACVSEWSCPKAAGGIRESVLECTQLGVWARPLTRTSPPGGGGGRVSAYAVVAASQRWLTDSVVRGGCTLGGACSTGAGDRRRQDEALAARRQPRRPRHQTRCAAELHTAAASPRSLCPHACHDSRRRSLSCRATSFVDRLSSRGSPLHRCSERHAEPHGASGWGVSGDRT
jgi:hypothetical protein